ncbi:Glycerol-3-phosphate dehydrogenase [NAD+], cytoplasmic, partial [Trachymyrmex zeteki]
IRRGSAIAKIVGANAKKQSSFADRVTMYVYEEIIDGKKLTEIINQTHENVKYLPGHKLPENVIAIPDVMEAAKDADILIFVVPHQFIQRICSTLQGKIKPTAVGLSLIKGFDKKEGGGIELISHIISKQLQIPISVLMGANLASEVADEMFCETTIGCKDKVMAPIFRNLIQTSYFRVVLVEDVDSVECCGALKNIVACGAGFVDGLGLGDNTKAAVIRLGLMEMIKFVDVFFPGGKLATFFESCGVADLITTCYGGRNRKVSEAFVKTGKSIETLEKEMLNGQKLQGPFTAEEVSYMLKLKNMEGRFPLFTAIHRICIGELKPTDLVDCIRSHPEHMGSAIAKIVGANAMKYNNIFETRVTMYVYEEIINNEKLTSIINTIHENVKYLPGHKIPENVAVPDVVEAAKDADILIFVLPHQFIRTLCSTLLDNIKPTAVGLSLIKQFELKGFGRGEGNSIELISKIIEKHLRIQCNVLMGANLANEVAEEKFCETTIGKSNAFHRGIIQRNIVACAAGFVDGLGLGDNTKAAVIRLGLMEMVKFVDTFYSGSKLSTFFESCGIADLITTCYGGRNRRVCEQFVKTGKTIKALEDELLSGQKLQGPATADEVHDMLKARNLMDKFPLFTAVHRICTDQLRPADLIDQIRSHPEHV